MIIDNHNRTWTDINLERITTITSSNNSIQIITDNDDFTITIPNGSYETVYTHHISELADTVNQILESENILAKAYLGRVHSDNKYSCLVFKMNNDDAITNVLGSFFE